MVKKFFSAFLLCLLICVTISQNAPPSPAAAASKAEESGEGFIKWVDFNITYEALKDAMELDIESFEQDLHLPWTESLAYLACKNGGNFDSYKKSDLTDFAKNRLSGSSTDQLTAPYKVYSYYYNAYSAVIGNLLGFREDGTYGLTAFSPLAAGYWYTESDDFGNGRNYGFSRKHLGHDMFCSVGTPVVSVEDGIIEAMGWNQYGGWRIGIRSRDKKRYYYYAHLRKDAPYAKDLKEGDPVRAGQIIGYTGQTGYSIKENVNNINVPHLHFGLQLIFDESQKECLSEIWINTYPLIRLLSANRSDASGKPASMPDTGAVLDTGAALDTGSVSGSKPSSDSAASGSDSLTAAAEDPAFDVTRQNETESQTASGSPGLNGESCSSKSKVKLPALMYHGITDQQNRLGDYYISAESFENDMRYLRKHGYTAVTMQELISFVYDRSGRRRLPEKPVLITFDDGYLNNHTFATQVLKKYGMKAVVSVIGSASREMSQTLYKNTASCAASISELRQMAESGVWEIQSHTYDLHRIEGGKRGASKAFGESPAAYKKRLRADLSKNQSFLKSVTGCIPNTFTWPYGAYSGNIRSLLEELGFRATLSCASGINEIKKGDTDCLYLLKRNIRKPDSDFPKLLS